MLRPIQVCPLTVNHWAHSNNISNCFDQGSSNCLLLCPSKSSLVIPDLNLDSSPWYYKPIPFQLHFQMKLGRLHICYTHSERDSMKLRLVQRLYNTMMSHCDVSRSHPDSLKLSVENVSLSFKNWPEYTDLKYNKSKNNFIPQKWFFDKNANIAKFEHNKIVSISLKVSSDKGLTLILKT